jgi:hypothetical protein
MERAERLLGERAMPAGDRDLAQSVQCARHQPTSRRGSKIISEVVDFPSVIGSR